MRPGPLDHIFNGFTAKCVEVRRGNLEAQDTCRGRFRKTGRGLVSSVDPNCFWVEMRLLLGVVVKQVSSY